MQHRHVIGVGNTATVYEWEDGKVLKLFYPGYPKDAVEREFHNAKAISNMEFAKPKAYEIIDCQGQMGIIYDRVRGESLLDWVMKTGDVQGCAKYMAELHKQILLNSIDNIPNCKEFLEVNIVKTLSTNPERAKEALQMLDKLPDGDTLCHGDFHPGNILIFDGHAAVMDFMNLCHGDFLYDVARTIFLVEYTPVPAESENKELILKLKKTLAELYLMEMDVTRDMIKDYLLVIIAARTGECPNEQLQCNIEI